MGAFDPHIVQGASVAVRPIALSARDAASYLAIGRSKIFELQREGKIVAKKCGGQNLYPIESLDAYFHSLPRAGATESQPS